MDKTIELVNKWGEFATKHPDGSIEDFCRYSLVNKREDKGPEILVGGVVPGIVDGLLLKIIGRIGKLNFFYANMALKGTGINQIEEFGLLLSIQLQQDLRKSDIIYSNLFELSSGTDMLNRMKKKGYITEHTDPEDKRSKIMRLTTEGASVVNRCKDRIVLNARMLMWDMPVDDKKLCIQLLKNVEIKFSSKWLKHKGKPFDEVYEEVTGEKLPKS